MKRGMLSLSKGGPSSQSHQQCYHQQDSAPRTQPEPSQPQVQSMPPEQGGTAAATIRPYAPDTIRISGVLSAVMKSHDDIAQRIYAKQKEVDSTPAPEPEPFAAQNKPPKMPPAIPVKLPGITTGTCTRNYFHTPSQ